MVQVALRGGLGNQMFEYSLGFVLAKKYKTDLVLDATFLNDRFPRKNFTYRNYDMDIFDLSPRFTAFSKISETMPVPGLWLGLDLGLAEVMSVLGARKIIREKDTQHFDPEVLLAGGNVRLWGFWQNWRYFDDVSDELRQTFRFKHPLPSEPTELAKKIMSTNSIALSVRRSDYTNSVNTKIFGATDTAYYDRAIAYLAANVTAPHFFIFSDDISWCREHIQPQFPTTYVPNELRGPKWAWTLELASLCKHHIIANSTFWWWAAWLSGNPGKIIIAPKRWGADSVDSSHIVPSQWLTL